MTPAHVAEDLLRRSVREIARAPLPTDVDLAYTVDVITDRVDDALPDDYWLPPSGRTLRRAVIAGIVQELISKGGLTTAQPRRAMAEFRFDPTKVPSLSDPIDGKPLIPGLGYVRRRSADGQASMWRELLAEDPFHGPASGFDIGIRSIDGLHTLVWQRQEA